MPGGAGGVASRDKVLNEQTLLMAMIEIPEAVENANAIAAVDGIDVPKPTLVSGTTVSPAGSGKRLGSRSDSKVPTMWPLPPEVLLV
jgi:hypothetical protein